MPNNLLPRDVVEAVLRLCEDVATPRSLTVAILLRHSEWDQIAELRCDPCKYTSALLYKWDAACTDILRKLAEMPTTFDRKQVALDNFHKSEAECFRTNLRLQPFLTEVLDGIPAVHPRDMGILRFIRRVRKIVSDTLGFCPDLIQGRFGPGATYGDRGRFTTIPDKMSSHPTLTSAALPFLFQWSGTSWATALVTAGKAPSTVRGNRFTTVPKDSTKDRGIAIEPSINVFYQLGYGKLLKARLKVAGLNLQDSQTIHRQVACEASIRGHFATLDLSNASDTVATDLVKLLLPAKWFEVLEMLRSPTTQLPDRKVRVLEKFSSMGNGFTFELETLIFASLSKAVLDELHLPSQWGVDLHVYGDDIIVPTESATEVQAVLRFFGFTLNEAKSFVEGPFRESCGGDYFEGVDVRPYFLKELPSEPQHFIAMANGLRKLATPDRYHPFNDGFNFRAWLRVMDAIPSHIRRLRGPEQLGDLVIHDEPQFWQSRWRNSRRYIRVWRPARYRKVAWDHFNEDAILACALYGLTVGNPGVKPGFNAGVIPRDAVSGYKQGWASFS